MPISQWQPQHLVPKKGLLPSLHWLRGLGKENRLVAISGYVLIRDARKHRNPLQPCPISHPAGTRSPLSCPLCTSSTCLVLSSVCVSAGSPHPQPSNGTAPQHLHSDLRRLLGCAFGNQRNADVPAVQLLFQVLQRRAMSATTARAAAKCRAARTSGNRARGH